MSVTGLLEGQASAGRLPSLGPMSTVGEATGAAFDFMRSNINVDASLRLHSEAFRARDQAYQDATGQNPWDATKAREVYPSRDPSAIEAMLAYHQKTLDDMITKGRQTDPEKYNGIKTKAEVEQAARDAANLDRKHYEEIMARASGTTKLVGGLAGSIAGGLTDPLNLAGMLVGVGEGRTILQSAAIEGALNAATEVVSTPAIMKWQKELGQKYGLGDAAEDVAGAFIGGAGLATIIKGAAPTFRKVSELFGSGSQRILDMVAQNEKLPPSVRDAATYMSRVAHVDESAPPGVIRSEEDLVVHRETVRKTAEDFENYKEPTLQPEGLPARETGITATAEGNQSIPLKENVKLSETTQKEITTKTETPEFKNWFGDSKVTGEDGKPLVVYHGSGKGDIEQFSPTAPGKSNPIYGAGIYFAPNPKLAGRFAEKVPYSGKNDGSIYPVYLSIKKPLVIDTLEKRNALTMQTRELTPEGVAKKIQADGYDGIIVKDMFNNLDQIVAFRPEQVKSVFNPGTFDPNDARISDAGPDMNDVAGTPKPIVKSPEEIKQADRMAAKRANFEQVMKENPDLKVTMEDGSQLTMKELLEKTKEDFNVIEALTTCRLE